MSDTELTLRTFSLPSTKAVTGLENFGLYAFYTSLPEGTNFLNTRTSEDPVIYIENGYFAPDPLSGIYGGFDPDLSKAKPYYYPLTGSLLFYGYSPYDTPIIQGDISYTTAYSISPYVYMTIEQKNQIGLMVDLLYFDILSLNGGKTIGKQAASPVDAEFKHAMAKVTFSFTDPLGQYSIAEASLQGCVNKAQFYISHDTGWAPLWDDPDLLENYTLYSTSTPLSSAPSSPGSLFIIPQYADGVFESMGHSTGAEMTLQMTITDGIGTQTVELPLSGHIDLFEMGKHYIFNISIHSGRIEFAPPLVENIEKGGE